MRKMLALLLALTILATCAMCEETYPNPSYTLTEMTVDISDMPVYVHRNVMERYGLGAPSTDETLQSIGICKDVFGEG